MKICILDSGTSGSAIDGAPTGAGAEATLIDKWTGLNAMLRRRPGTVQCGFAASLPR